MVGKVTKIMSNVFEYPLSAMVKNKHYKKFIEGKITNKTFDNAVAYATLASIVAKDGIGCIMYVEQSKHNKKIPEERRNFVWKLDAVNGGLMMGFQILFFLGMRKFNDKLFDKCFPSFRSSFLRIVKGAQRAAAKKANKIPKTKSEYDSEHISAKSAGLSIFRSVTELVASTILAKRVVVPFIATYLTDKLESKHNKKVETNSIDNNENNNITPEITEEPKIDIINTDNGDTNLIERYKHNIK